MFKLNKAELKKIFLRPAVYVMLFLLSAALVISAFMYSPAPRANPTTNFGGANETISMAFSAFKTSSSEDAKPALDAALANAKETVEGFAAQSSLHKSLADGFAEVEYSLTHNDASKETFAFALWQYAALQTEEHRIQFVESAAALAETADALFQTCQSGINAQTIDFYITTADLEIVKDYCQNLYLSIPSTSDLNQFTREALLEFGDNLKQNYVPTAEKAIIDNAQLIAFTPENATEIISAYFAPVAYEDGSESVLTAIYADIESFVTQNADETSAEAKAQFNELATQYKLATQIAINLIENNFVLQKAGDYSNAQLKHFIGFEDFNSYAINEQIVLNNYLLENQIFDGDYLVNFNFGTSSGYTNSAYDFCVFAMQILSLILTIFALYFGVTIMAGDFQNGAIKMLATRPLTRTQIVGGKTMACVNFTLIFAIFAMVASFVAGFAMFGLGDASSIITVFNGANVLVVHPAIMLLAYFASLMLNLIFYIVLAMLFAVIFRSGIGALITTFAVFVANIILGALFTGATWFVFMPFAYLDLFRFMGGASVQGGFLTFGVTLGGSFFIALAVYLAMVVVIDLLSKLIFKSRDIT
ncbi:MAG: ABC transporter permease subunit [Clostridia bacterium]|nr:ABC transporter permease subunit [Clostridia bacterium]